MFVLVWVFFRHFDTGDYFSCKQYMVVVSGDSSARLLPVPCVTGRRSARQYDGLPNEVLLFGFVLQSWARLRMSPPLSLPWSWMDWRSTPTTASRCWPSPAQGMASEASRSSPAPKRMVRHRCVGTGWETQILNVPGHTGLVSGRKPLPHSLWSSLPFYTAQRESGPPPPATLLDVIIDWS